MTNTNPTLKRRAAARQFRATIGKRHKQPAKPRIFGMRKGRQKINTSRFERGGN
jgi:hypothetical protein